MSSGAEVRAVEDVLADHAARSPVAEHGGYVYWLSIDGVRKQLTSTPFNGRGGYVPGTPSTIEELPARVDEIPQTGLSDCGAVRDEEAVVRVVGSVSKAVDAKIPGVRLAIMHDQAGTVIGGMIDVRRPHDPCSMSLDSVGSSSRQRSSTSEGSAQSSPMIITFVSANRNRPPSGRSVGEPPTLDERHFRPYR